MNQIYTDRSQCEKFGVDYFTGTSLVVSAEALLDSKLHSGGYDSEHREFLESLGGATLSLVRDEDYEPGWWMVYEIIASSARVPRTPIKTVYVCPRCSEPSLRSHDSDHGTIYECVNRCWVGEVPDEISESELPE